MNTNVKLQDLSLEEARQVDGGSKLSWLGAVIDYIDENWKDIKQAAKDAWNGN